MNESAQIEAFRRIRAAVDAALAALEPHPELLEVIADFVPAHRKFGIPRAARMLPIARAWRLGVLLLRNDGNLVQASEVTRSIEPPKGGHNSAYRDQRQVFTAAAFRARLPEGTVVNFNTTPISLDAAELQREESLVFARDNEVWIRWANRAGRDGLMPFDAYLRERVELLLHPPQGATVE